MDWIEDYELYKFYEYLNSICLPNGSRQWPKPKPKPIFKPKNRYQNLKDWTFVIFKDSDKILYGLNRGHWTL